MRKNNYGLVKVFCEYYNDEINSCNTYEDCLHYIQDNYNDMEALTLRDVKSISWNLNRNGILNTKRENAIDGKLYSRKTINKNNLLKLMNIKL